MITPYQFLKPLRQMSPFLCLAGFIVVLSLTHIPSTLEALNYFDSPKRFLWSVCTVMLSASALFARREDQRARSFGVMVCIVWILFRSLVREGPIIGLDELVNWMLPAALFGIGLTLDRERSIKPVAWALILSGGIQAILMMTQYMGIDPLFRPITGAMDYRPGRMLGTVGYHNQAADFLAVCSVGLFFVVHSPALRLLLTGGVLLVVGLTASRAGIVGMVGAMAASELSRLLLTKGNRRRIALQLLLPATVVAILAGCMVLFMPATRERFTDVLRHPERVPAISSRLTMAKVACAMWAEKPFTGWGAGAFAMQYLDRLGDVLPDEKTHPDIKDLVYARETHNETLQFAAEFGLLGLAGLLCLVICAGVSLFRVGDTDSSRRNACIFLFFYMLISGMFAFPWQTALAGPLAALLLGIMLPRMDRHPSPPPPHPPSQWDWRHMGLRVFLLGLSLAMLAWCSIEARLNLMLPRIIRRASASRAEAAAYIPSQMYKFHALMGAALAHDGDYDRALRTLQHAHMGHRDVLLYNNLGNVYANRGDWNRAIAVYQAWAASGIDYSTALKNLSTAYEQAGDARNAALTMSRQMRLWRDEHHLAAVHRVVTLYLKAGMKDDALRMLKWFESSALFDPRKCPATFDNLAGAVLLATGHRAEAEVRFRLALRKDPALQSARRNLDGLPRE